MGFEPMRSLDLIRLKVTALDHSANSPYLVGNKGFEPST